MTGCTKKRKFRGRFRMGRKFLVDDGGVISIMAALSLAIVLAIAAIVADAGVLLLERRSLQATTDAAALSAAQHLPDGAQAAAAEVLAANGYGTANIERIETGIYKADETIPATSRFVVATNDPAINAVRIVTKSDAPTYFARALGLSSFNTVHTRATAATVATASFGAGTRLAQLNGGLVNQLLGGLVGANLSLSLIDYQALANTKISALAFLDALATRTGISAGSRYEDLLSSGVTMGNILGAGLDVLRDASSGASGSVSGSISALNTLSGQVPPGTTVTLGNLIAAPSIAGRTIGSIGVGGDGAQLDLYNLVAAAARTAGAGKKVNVDTGLTLPIANTVLKASVAIGEPMAQIAHGTVGTFIRTSQVRIALNVQLLNVSIPLLLSTSVNVPIYVEMAQGTATLTAIPCQPERMVTLLGTSGAVSARYGDAGSGFTNFATSPTISDPAIVDLQVLFVSVPIKASGAASVASGSGSVDFSQADIDGDTIRSINGTGASQLFPNLASALRLSVAGANVPSALTSLVFNAVNALGSPVSALLTTLGIQLGVLDMTVSGAKCGVPVLVG